MGVANAALLLAAVIVCAALVDSVAGIATAVVGATMLNYFHTAPIHSFRITESSDVMAVLLLAGLGVIVSAATAFRVGERIRNYHSEISRDGRAALRRASHDETPAAALWHAAVDAESGGLATLEVRLVASGTSRLPVVARHPNAPDEASTDHEMVTIPVSGAVVILRDPRLGLDVVLRPRDTHEPAELRRSAVFMFADSIELALTHM